MTETIDLRGRQLAPVPAPVLADPSGRRSLLLARAWRVVAVVGLLWLAGLVLAGLGILPAGVVPLGRALAAPGAPPILRTVLVQPGTASDLAPAVPASGIDGARGMGGVALLPRGARRSHGGAPSGKGGLSAPTTPGRVGVGKPKGAATTTAGSTGGAGTTTSAGATTTTTTTSTKSAPGQTNKQTTPGHTKDDGAGELRLSSWRSEEHTSELQSLRH